MLRPRERGNLRPFFPTQEGVSDPFSHRTRENPVPPKIHLAKIPLAQCMSYACVLEIACEKPVKAGERLFDS